MKKFLVLSIIAGIVSFIQNVEKVKNIVNDSKKCVVAFTVEGIHCKECEKPLFASVSSVIKPTLSSIKDSSTLVLKFEGDCENDKRKLLDAINKTENAMGSKFSAKEILLTRYYIPGMECPACVSLIKEALQKVENIGGNLSVFVDEISDDVSETGIYVSFGKGQSKELDIKKINEDVIKAISEAGFKAFTVKQKGLKLDKIETVSEKIHCEGCAKKIVSELIQDKDVYKVKVNPDTKKIKIIVVSDKKDEDIKKLLEDLGFPVTGKFERTALTAQKEECSKEGSGVCERAARTAECNCKESMPDCNCSHCSGNVNICPCGQHQKSGNSDHKHHHHHHDE